MAEFTTSLQLATLQSTTTPLQEAMQVAAKEAAEVLRVLANDDRLLLLCFLSQGEANVGELEVALGIKQPTLSQQLGVMRKQRVVETRRVGKHIYYRIEDPKIFKLLQTMYELYCPKQA